MDAWASSELLQVPTVLNSEWFWLYGAFAGLVLGRSRIKILYGIKDSYYHVITHKQQTQRNLNSQTGSLQAERYEQAAQDLECLIGSLEDLREACNLMALTFPPLSKAG